MKISRLIGKILLAIYDRTIMKIPNKKLDSFQKVVVMKRYIKDIPPQLQICSWEEFYFENDGNKLICVGTDAYAGSFANQAKNSYQIQKFVTEEVIDTKIGDKIITTSDFASITDEEREKCTFIITSLYYFRDYCNLLIENNISKFYAVSIMNYLQNKNKMDFYGGMLNFRTKLPFYVSKDGFLKNYIGFEFGAFLRKCKLGNYKKYKDLKKFQDIHLGERCFILATGPSLRVEDVEALSNEYTFGVNGIFSLYDKTEWRPTYYAMCDKEVYKKAMKSNENFSFDNFYRKSAFVSNQMSLNESKTKNFEDVKIVPFSYLDHFFTAEYVSLKYSSDLIHGLYNMQTVTNFCINIAQYMGFKEIYLLGVDFSYSSKDKQQHFDGTRNVLMDDDIIRQSVVFNTRRSYELVKRETEKAGVKVFNATRGGKLEVFERIDFDKLNLK